MAGAKVMKMVRHSLVPGDIDEASGCFSYGLVFPFFPLNFYYTAGDQYKFDQKRNKRWDHL